VHRARGLSAESRWRERKTREEEEEEEEEEEGGLEKNGGE